MININNPHVQDCAIALIQAENRHCHVCGKAFVRFYIEKAEPGDDRAGVVRVSAHCDTPGHNLHVFRVTAEELA